MPATDRRHYVESALAHPPPAGHAAARLVVQEARADHHIGLAGQYGLQQGLNGVRSVLAVPVAGNERPGSNACPSTNRPPPCPPHPFRRGGVCYAPAGLGSSQCSARERGKAFPLPLFRTADHLRATFLPWRRTVRGTLT